MARGSKELGASRKPSPMVVAAVVVVAVFAAIVGFGVFYTHQAATDVVPPVGGDAAGITVGNAAAPATIDVYLDFQCPVCRQYENQSGATIDQLVASGKAKVVYHPVAYLDRFSSTKYSTRSSAASACAADAGVFPQYLKLLYANQPPENSPGLPDAQLVDLARQAGAPDAVASCIDSHRHNGWTASVTDAASQAGVNGTPTVKVNGKEIERTDAALRAAVG